jgi:hypothetical protein
MRSEKTRKPPFRLAYQAFHPGPLPVDALLDRARGRGGRWFHRPFSADEIREHPDADRLVATIEAAVQAALAVVQEDAGEKQDGR